MIADGKRVFEKQCFILKKGKLDTFFVFLNK